MTDNLTGAIDALTNGQRQLDPDGVFVGVSRQALDEVLEHVTRDKTRTIYVQFSVIGTIRKWSWEPFDTAEPLIAESGGVSDNICTNFCPCCKTLADDLEAMTHARNDALSLAETFEAELIEQCRITSAAAEVELSPRSHDHRLAERARIVAWLRAQWRDCARTSRIEVLDFADAIEAGEHLK